MSIITRCGSRTRYALVLIFLVMFLVPFVPAEVCAGDDDIWQPGWENRPDENNCPTKEGVWDGRKDHGWGDPAKQKPADNQPMKGVVTAILINTLIRLTSQLPTLN